MNPLKIIAMKSITIITTVFTSVLLLLIVVNPENASAQEAPKKELQQYLFPAFTKCSVTMKSGRILSVMLNYNMVSEKMVFEQNGEYFDMVNPETVDTAYIQNRAFIPHEKVFLEVVQKGKLPFFIQHKGDLQAPGRPAGYGTTSELTSSNYLSGINTPQGYYNFKLPDGYTVRTSYIYWVKIENRMESFIGERQFLKLFPGKEDQLKKYLRESKIKIDRLEDYKQLVKYCNDNL